MKYLLLLSLIPLAGCEAFSAAAVDPGIQAGVQKAAEDAASGNYVGAIIGIVGTITTYLTYKSGKHVVKRMKESEPGKII